MTRNSSPRLYLVDGYALIFRSFFALGEQQLVSSKGENTGIAHGAAEFLRRFLERHRPAYVGWVHDAGHSFRHDVFPAYKATRERLDPGQQADFDTGLERITQLLEGYRIPVLSLDGFEADDVIGTLARQAGEAGIETVIVSGDKDFMQLVAPGVSVLNPWHGRPGRTTEKWYDAGNATERLGVPPERVVDYLALLGDSSDNIPGVRGVGEKTAKALIDRWGPLENILAHAGEVEPARARTALAEHGSEGELSKQLLTIRTDLPMKLDLAALTTREPDWTRLRNLFVELEFRAQAADAAGRAEAPVSETTAGPGQRPAGSHIIVDDPAAIAGLVAELRAAGSFALSLQAAPETGASGRNPLRAHAVALALSPGPGKAYYLPLRHRPPEGDEPTLGVGEPTATESPVVRNLPDLHSHAMASVRELLADHSVRKTVHDGKHGILVLRRGGVTLGGLDFDPMLASYLMDPGRRSHALEALAVELLQRPIPSLEDVAGKGRLQVPFDRIPIAAARDHLAASAEATMALRSVLEPRLHEVGAFRLLREVELPLSSVLAEMEWTGVCIDIPWLHSLKSRFARERRQAEAAIYEVAGEHFNINSNKQLATVLFERMGLPVRKKTSTGPSTDASVLQQLADEGHSLPALILEYREFAKLESTYLDTLPALVHPTTGRLHTSYSQATAATGRLASSDPNLQNIPIRRDLGRDIRRGFVPREGWLFLAADYSQVELRLLAHLSQDEAFVEAFAAGGDIHRQTASLIFGVSVEDVTPEMRARAKTINFATIYGQGAHALAQQLRIEHAEARAFIDTYFTRFAGVRRFLDQAVASARERGYAETILGRRRYIPELRDRNFNIRAFGERTAQNSPIQGSAADLIKVAMIRIHAELAASGMRAKMLMQVHDELVFESPPEELSGLERLVRHEMTTAVPLRVPLVVDVGTGTNWLEAKA